MEGGGERGIKRIKAGKLDLANLSDSVYFTWKHFKTDYMSEGYFKFCTTTKLCSTWHLVPRKSMNTEFTNYDFLFRPKTMMFRYQLSLLALAIRNECGISFLSWRFSEEPQNLRQYVFFFLKPTNLNKWLTCRAKPKTVHFLILLQILCTGVHGKIAEALRKYAKKKQLWHWKNMQKIALASIKFL